MKSDAGKGSDPRPFSNYKDYSSRWDNINWENSKKDKNEQRKTKRRTKKSN